MIRRRLVVAGLTASVWLAATLSGCTGDRSEAGQTASATASRVPSPTVEPDSPGLELTWEVSATDLTTAANPFVSGIVAADAETWLVHLIGGPDGAGAAQLIPVDPATGQPKTPTEGAAGMPEDVFCGERTWEGQVLCAWGDAVYAIDAATGLPARDAPLARVPGQDLYGVDVAGGLIVSVGLAGTVPSATAFTGDGAVVWRAAFGVEGCQLEDPAYGVTIAEDGGAVRLSVVSQNALISLDSGAVLVAACGLAAWSDDGRLAVARRYGDEPSPPDSYTAADGTIRAVVEAGTADQLTALTADGKQYVAAMEIENKRLRLVDLEAGAQLWEQSWEYGRVQAWDDQRLYLTGRQGLAAVELLTGETIWTWEQEGGMSARTAVLTRDAGLVVAHSSGVSGVDPRTGQGSWFIQDSELAAYYWTPTGLGPMEASKSDTIVFIGPGRDRIVRLDPETSGDE